MLTYALEICSSKVSTLDSQVAEEPLLVCLLQYVFFDGTLANQSSYIKSGKENLT